MEEVTGKMEEVTGKMEEVTGKQRKSQASRGGHRQAEVVTGKMPVPQAEEKELASFIE